MYIINHVVIRLKENLLYSFIILPHVGGNDGFSRFPLNVKYALNCNLSKYKVLIGSL